PAGFHVVFEASYALAHELASVRSAEISVFRSLAFPGPNLWRLSLSRSPGSMEARNSELRRLSEQLVLVAQMMRRKELSAGSDKPGKKTKSVRQTKPRRRAA